MCVCLIYTPYTLDVWCVPTLLVVAYPVCCPLVCLSSSASPAQRPGRSLPVPGMEDTANSDMKGAGLTIKNGEMLGFNRNTAVSVACDLVNAMLWIKFEHVLASVGRIIG